MSLQPIQLDLSFRGLTRLFGKNNVKLTRRGLTLAFPKCCPLSAIAVIHGTTYGNLPDYLDEETNLKIDSIEAGFEGWVGDDDEVYIDRYVKIGKRLYEASYGGTAG